MDVTRCLLSAPGLLKFLWGEVCCTAAYIINRLSHAVLKDDTPCHRLFGNLLGKLGMEPETFSIYMDSTGALHLAGNATFSGRTKHISTKYYMMRDWIDNGKIRIHHVQGTLQLSDLLTKHLSRPTFQRLKEMIQAYGSRSTSSKCQDFGSLPHTEPLPTVTSPFWMGKVLKKDEQQVTARTCRSVPHAISTFALQDHEMSSTTEDLGELRTTWTNDQERRHL